MSKRLIPQLTSCKRKWCFRQLCLVSKKDYSLSRKAVPQRENNILTFHRSVLLVLIKFTQRCQTCLLLWMFINGFVPVHSGVGVSARLSLSVVAAGPLLCRDPKQRSKTPCYTFLRTLRTALIYLRDHILAKPIHGAKQNDNICRCVCVFACVYFVCRFNKCNCMCFMCLYERVVSWSCVCVCVCACNKVVMWCMLQDCDLFSLRLCDKLAVSYGDTPEITALQFDLVCQGT